jgi:hypothetical protein
MKNSRVQKNGRFFILYQDMPGGLEKYGEEEKFSYSHLS